ncbi:hypothetical protein FANBOY_00600 [Brevundimonas phage vB_BgoS-Fanboy]|nr:hypothetical protein FANBOY_00600 [Brevundimonas phage vB_BgoS-Fanboy]
MTPFESFFAHDFQRLLDSVPDEKLYSCNIRGLRGSSWDRKAAFLVWDAMGRPDDSAGRTFPGSTAKRAPATDPADLFSGLPETGQTCSECGLFQRQSPGGEVCANGHGGVQGEEPQTHYWYHPESDSLFTTAPGEAFPGDPLVEHIDADIYADLKAKQDADDPFACLDAPAEQPQDDDPFAIL